MFSARSHTFTILGSLEIKRKKEREAAEGLDGRSDKGSMVGTEATPSEVSKLSPRGTPPISPREDSMSPSRKLPTHISMHVGGQHPSPRTQERAALRLPLTPATNASAVLDARWQDIGLFPGAKAHGPKRQESEGGGSSSADGGGPHRQMSNE